MKCRVARRKKLSIKILDVHRDDISSAETDTASSTEQGLEKASGARKHSLSTPRRKGVRFTEQVSMRLFTQNDWIVDPTTKINFLK